MHFTPGPTAKPNGKHVPLTNEAVLKDPVLMYGRLVRDAATIGELLRTLPQDVDGYHGILQVMLSLARAMEANLKRMVEQVEA